MIYTNQEALRIVTNSYYAYANGTHFSNKDMEELEDLIVELINIKFEFKRTVKNLNKFTEVK